MALFDLHHPWLFVFGVLGNIISLFVFLAPVPSFRRICKEKSTMGYQSVPYVVALFSSMLWIYYALIKTNTMLLISINTFGCVVETIYISIFLFYASKEARKQTVKLLASLIGGLYTLIFLVTFFPFHGALRVQVVGWICVAIAVAVFAAPLSILFQVVQTKSVEFMPFTLSFFLTLSAIMWFGYGLLQRDLCVALPNVLGFFLGMIQMLLYGLYKNAKPKVEQDKKVPEHVINMVVLGNSDQIHPVNSETSEDMVKQLDDDQTPDEQVPEESHVTPPVAIQPPAVASNDRETTEERGSERELAHVNLPQQQLETPVLVVCAAA